MDTTGKLAPGIVGITVCMILVLAVALPVIGAMIATIDVEEASGTNEISQSQGLTKFTEPAEWHYSDGRVSMGGGQAQDLQDWTMFTDSMVIQAILDLEQNPVLRVFRGPGDFMMYSEADVSFDGRTLAVVGSGSGTASRTMSDDSPYVLATYVAAFGEMDYGYTDSASMGVVIGDGATMVRPIVSSSIRDNSNVTGMLFFDGRSFKAVDTGDVDLSGLSANMGTENVDGISVPTVGSVMNGDTYITGWYAPFDWTYTEDSPGAMAKTVLNILPLILVVALFVLVVRWMQSGTGGLETSAFLGGSRAPRRPNDGWRDKR